MDQTLPLLRHKNTPEILKSYLQIGNTVEVVEHDKLSIVEGVIQDVRIGDDMILFQPTTGNSMLVERRRVRPVSSSRKYKSSTELWGTGEFKLYEIVDVLIEGKWLVGAIGQIPTSIEDKYSVHIFRDDLTVSVTTSMRRHLEWDNINGWTYDICKLERERLKAPDQFEVGLVGTHKAKILQYVDDEHVLVEYMDLKRPNGTHAKEIIRRKKWHRSILRKRWEELRAWINADDPVAEFGCYMPAYICLGILGVVSPILFTDSAQHWPNDLVVLFYTFGGISFFLCLFILIGLTCRQPKTRAELNKWRVICIIAVATGVVFLALHAAYGRLDFVKNREPKGQGTDVMD